ncbi:AhpC-TSA-domain-containing protein [Calocera viscosa TUFC12733]|uniref:thioredoxin-dependent peroxiredoxin n=1 Tax=Calocera viscosa (strain TUFC12733) TaxID=1330018 RepID=A0A167GPY0_CALVF|nr:AhpC-TSA-domain-containing protein [Calocera viscosa TUFC12733]
MAPRAKKESAAEPTRRSTRLADKPAVPAAAAPAKPAAAKKEKEPVKEKESKKRAAEEKAEEPAAKKAKPAAEKPKPASKVKPASKAKPASKKAAAAKEEPIVEAVEEEKAAAEAEVVAEAPKEAPKEPAGELELGDLLPELTLKNQAEEDVAVKSLAGADKGLILFLVPKANTPGCTKQACGFRDSYPSYTGLGYEVYCVSGDLPAAQAKWKSGQKLPYPLLSDPSHALIKALGASSPGNKTKRSHFIFEKGSGKLVLKSLGVKPEESPKQVLAFLESHK